MATDARVTIYTTQTCPYCIRAKNLLKLKQVSFNEIKVDNNPELRREMTKKCHRRTVPQIWIGKTHIGGFDDLWQLETQGQLDPLLAENSTANV